MSKDNKIIKNRGGRPTKMTEGLVKKLESVFQLGVKDTTACTYAGISRETYYNWIKANQEFSDRIAKAKEFARIAAGQVVVNAIIKDKDLATAKWWLEKKYPDEFGSAPGILQQFNVEGGEDMSIEFVVDERYVTKDEDKTSPRSV
jgi:hypothetical protein